MIMWLNMAAEILIEEMNGQIPYLVLRKLIPLSFFGYHWVEKAQLLFFFYFFLYRSIPW